MIVLIDKILKNVNAGYVIEKRNGISCQVAYHGSLVEYINSKVENMRLITSGHVYIINYNEDTYVSLKPETFEEYLIMREEGLPMWKK